MSDITRISVDMPSELHKLVKHVAIHNDVSIRDFVIEAVQEKLRKKSAKKPRKKALKGAALTLDTIEKSKRGEDLVHIGSYQNFVKYIRSL